MVTPFDAESGRYRSKLALIHLAQTLKYLGLYVAGIKKNKKTGDLKQDRGNKKA